jgi:hypothetical protein
MFDLSHSKKKKKRLDLLIDIIFNQHRRLARYTALTLSEKCGAKQRSSDSLLERDICSISTIDWKCIVFVYSAYRS